MRITTFIDFFIHPNYFNQPNTLRRARLFVRGCLLTSFFSSTYIWLSLVFDYEKGVYMMSANVIGFLLLPFLSKTKLPLSWLGNVYVTLGAVAVLVLTYFSGGVWSAIYPWIVAIPVLALLVVNRLSGAIWGGISFAFMLFFGVLANLGVELPVEYNVELQTLWYTSVLPGLLLIILFIGLVFEFVQTRALTELEQKNHLLEKQTRTITSQSAALEKLIEEKDYIIRILAHDLRNPLSNINGLAGLVETKRYTGQQGEFVSMVKQCATSALHLIQRVLEMDRADQRDLEVEVEPVNLVHALSELVESMQEMARRKEIEICLDNHSEVSMVRGERIYLIQIFENLISNALKFSERGKRVEIHLADHATHLRVKVIDQGPGILPGEESKLFQKFARLSARPTAEESSSGLGLSLVKRYVELLKGRIWYEGKAGVGAVFVVELPLAGVAKG